MIYNWPDTQMQAVNTKLKVVISDVVCARQFRVEISQSKCRIYTPEDHAAATLSIKISITNHHKPSHLHKASIHNNA